MMQHLCGASVVAFQFEEVLKVFWVWHPELPEMKVEVVVLAFWFASKCRWDQPPHEVASRHSSRIFTASVFLWPTCLSPSPFLPLPVVHSTAWVTDVLWLMCSEPLQFSLLCRVGVPRGGGQVGGSRDGLVGLAGGSQTILAQSGLNSQAGGSLTILARRRLNSQAPGSLMQSGRQLGSPMPGPRVGGSAHALSSWTMCEGGNVTWGRTWKIGRNPIKGECLTLWHGQRRIADGLTTNEHTSLALQCCAKTMWKWHGLPFRAQCWLVFEQMLSLGHLGCLLWRTASTVSEHTRWVFPSFLLAELCLWTCVRFSHRGQSHLRCWVPTSPKSLTSPSAASSSHGTTLSNFSAKMLQHQVRFSSSEFWNPAGSVMSQTTAFQITWPLMLGLRQAKSLPSTPDQRNVSHFLSLIPILLQL